MAGKTCAAGGCGMAKSADVHSRHYRGADGHPFVLDGPVGLQPVSAPRRAYMASQEHKEAYGVAEAYCVGHALDAPGKCMPPLTPHHTLKQSYAGKKYAEANAPVVTLCAWLNGAIESDPEVRAWALRATFNRNGVDYPFLIDKVSHDRERSEEETRESARPSPGKRSMLR